MSRLIRNLPFFFAGIYNLYDSLSVNNQPLLRGLFALFAASVFAAVFLGQENLPSAKKVGGILGLALLALAPTAVSPNFQLLSVAGDTMVIVTIGMTALFASSIVQDMRLVSRGMWLFFGLSLTGALIAPFFPTAIGGRFEPAAIVTLATLVVVVSIRRPSRYRLIALFGLALLATLGFFSGFRTMLVLVFFAGVLLVYIKRGQVGVIGAGLVVAFVASVSGLLGFNPLGPLFESQAGRLGSLASGQIDASIFSRFVEAEDVIDTANNEWKFGQLIFGSGAGATYVPQRILIEQNVDDFGRVHNIHIGPVLAYFRHGILGLGLMVFVVRRVRRSLSLLRNRVRSGAVFSDADGWAAVTVVMSVLYLTDFLVRNSSINPGFSIAIGFTIAYCWQSSSVEAPIRQYEDALR